MEKEITITIYTHIYIYVGGGGVLGRSEHTFSSLRSLVIPIAKSNT